MEPINKMEAGRPRAGAIASESDPLTDGKPGGTGRRWGPQQYFVNKRVFREGYPFGILAVNALAPAFIFVVLSIWMISQFRFEQPLVWKYCVWAFVIFVYAFCVSLPVMVVGRPMHAYGLLMVLALGAAVGLGDLNYVFNMYPYYRLNSLEERTNLNPSSVNWWWVRDTGKVYFWENVKVMASRGMSYTDWDTYCVAPIVEEGNERLTSYPFWAVGVNCCETENADFSKCGQVLDRSVRSGIRLMYPEQVPYFKLAVEQSEARYGIQAAQEPIFVYWVADPAMELRDLHRLGLESFIYSSCLISAISMALALGLTSGKK